MKSSIFPVLVGATALATPWIRPEMGSIKSPQFPRTQAEKKAMLKAKKKQKAAKQARKRNRR